MGEHGVVEANDETRGTFTKALLDDVAALERMIDEGRIERGVRRIGAEQEMFLVGSDMNAAPVAMEVLARIDDPRLTTELARYNLEANLTPREFGGGCLRALEHEIEECIGIVRNAARELEADVLLTGILPTLRKTDLGLDNLTPAPRYHELNRTMRTLRGADFHILISGIDELDTTHDNVMLESCNTSFQVHVQVSAEEFASLYNLAQVVTAPVLAAAVNSPVLLQRRLWAETRVALFERSIDVRTDNERRQRPSPARVTFGDEWVRESVLEVFRRDISRFRIMLSRELEEKPLQLLDAGEIPRLRALQLHNGTVWRWNRPCYGVTEGEPHLRIENRALPAGPTVLDEVANAAFLFGTMIALGDAAPRVDERIRFDDAKANFFAAGRHGLRAQFEWLDGRTVTAADLVLSELLPAARDGLRGRGIDPSDIDRYLGVVEERVRSGVTGSRWILSSLAAMDRNARADARYRTLTSTMLERSHEGNPVHTWPLAVLPASSRPLRASIEKVGQLMSTSLVTVRPGDIIDLAASLMDWEQVRHVPVEDAEGRLVGLLSHRQLLRLVARGRSPQSPLRVEEVMARDPITTTPDTPTLDAIAKMREHQVSCLPVLENGKLVGIITERDLIQITARLLEEYLESGKT
jgi:CBS domain-containing protein